jgi:hypothetical protein
MLNNEPKLERQTFRQKEERTDNSGFKKLAVQWLNEALCFVSSSVLADSFRLRNRQLLVAAKRCASAKKTLGGKFYLMDLMLNQYIK